MTKTCSKLESDVFCLKWLSIVAGIGAVLAVGLAIFSSAPGAIGASSVMVGFFVCIWTGGVRLFKERHGKYPWQA